jgi:protein BUR2
MHAISSQALPQHIEPPDPADSQWYFTDAELLRAPSINAGLTPHKERENRSKGVNFILQVGIMLKLPQITLGTASVFLHRFFMRHSMIEDKVSIPGVTKPGQHYYSVAATCLFLATKVEENCRKMKELVIACVRVAQKNPTKLVDEQDKEFWRWKDTILQMEDTLLEALCFDLNLEPPYRTLYDLLCLFGEQENRRLRNAAWAFVNDSCISTLCLQFTSRTIAASAVYAAARHNDVRFPDDVDGRPWWEVIGVELRDLRRACNIMAGIYESTPSRGDGIYVLTPEDGSELDAKTRERRNGLNTPSRDRRGSGGSVTSDGSKKRGRTEEAEDVPWIGESREEFETRRKEEYEAKQKYEAENAKRRKLEMNGTNGVSESHTNGSVGPVPSIEEPKPVGSSKGYDDTEEGEVAS